MARPGSPTNSNGSRVRWSEHRPSRVSICRARTGRCGSRRYQTNPSRGLRISWFGCCKALGPYCRFCNTTPFPTSLHATFARPRTCTISRAEMNGAPRAPGGEGIIKVFILRRYHCAPPHPSPRFKQEATETTVECCGGFGPVAARVLIATTPR